MPETIELILRMCHIALTVRQYYMIGQRKSMTSVIIHLRNAFYFVFLGPALQQKYLKVSCT